MGYTHSVQVLVLILSVLVARQVPPASPKSQGKVPTMQAVPVPLVEMDEELAQRLFEKELVAEEA